MRPNSGWCENCGWGHDFRTVRNLCPACEAYQRRTGAPRPLYLAQRRVDRKWQRSPRADQIRDRFDLEPHEFWWRLARGYLDPEREDVKRILAGIAPQDLRDELVRAVQRKGA